MAGEQIFIGLTTSGLCAVGLTREIWLLSETRKGQRLVNLCGTQGALWVLRALLVAGVLFGLALAGGVINPVRWSAAQPSTRLKEACLSQAEGSRNGAQIQAGLGTC